MGTEWLPPIGFGRISFSYMENFLNYLIENEDTIEIITYDDLPWEDDYRYMSYYPEEFNRWNKIRDLNKIYIILQHDIDMLPDRTIRVLKIEENLGIRSNIMIFNKYINRLLLDYQNILQYENYNLDFEYFKYLQEKGFVFGYHCNAYEQANFVFEKASQILENDVMELRKYLNINYFSAHGGVLGTNNTNNSCVQLPKYLKLRPVHNYHGIKCLGYSDTLFFQHNVTIFDFLKKMKLGNRYQILLHPQYYHDPYIPYSLETNGGKAMSQNNDYVKNQEALYKSQNDPWGNIDPNHLRFKLYEKYNKTIISLLDNKHKLVVDMGCGLGKLVNIINKTMDKKAIGVDSSSTAIGRAKKHFKEWDYIVGDIRTWKPNENVDAVVSTGPYYHFPKNERMTILEHIYSYLNNGGILIIAYGCNSYLSGRRRVDYPDISKEIFSVFKPQQVLTLMAIDNTNGQEASWTFYVGEK